MSFGAGHHLQLVDGSGYIFRAYHALPPLTRKSDGLPVGAVSGFCAMLLKLLEEQRGSDAPTHSAVVFDAKGPSFRNDIFKDYKANRPPAPEDLVPQFPLTRDAVRAFSIAALELAGYEADDIIATLAAKARDAGGRVTIISSDKDLMQMVGGGIEMYDTMKNRRIGIEQVEEKFGVGPERVIDVQALAGDSTDNVPGAPGIGIKTAAMLIGEYGDLETLLERAEEIKQPKRRDALVSFADQIRVSKRLVELARDVPLEVSLDDLETRDPEPEKLLEFLGKMEFRTLSKRVAERFGAEAPSIPDAPAHEAKRIPFDPDAYECVRDAESLRAWLERARAKGRVAVDTETTGLDEMRDSLVGVCLATGPGEACYVPLAHKPLGEELFTQEVLEEGQIPFEEAIALMKPVLEDSSILKIGHNIKFDAKVLGRCGVSVDPIDDTLLMSYALHGGKHNHGMDKVSEIYLGHKPIEIKSLLGSGKSAITFDRVETKAATRYAAEDADVTIRLWERFKPELHRSRVTTVYETLERPLVPVLADMERAGIKVDGDTLRRMSGAFAGRMVDLEGRIHEAAGQKFNVGSPKQLGEVLFDNLKLPGGERGKTGAYGTGADVLGDLAAETGSPVPPLVLEWRQVAKLKSTYTDALQEHVNPETGRVHTSYSIAGANTGRLASTDPNLQNIPVRTEDGRRIREAFIAEPGHVLLSLDYSQIELRILAEVAGIGALKEAFKEGLDIHAMTASEMFGVPVKDMDPAIRRQAKAINFGVIYGISGYGLARNLHIPRAEADRFIKTYFERFPGIREYMDRTVEFARENGYVETLFGRRIHTPHIKDKGAHGAFARRAAINAPIQGAAADVIRRAMIRMPRAIEGLPARMLLQVHDELLFEVEEGAVEETIAAVREVMENAHKPVAWLGVALTVDAGQGANWAEAH